MRELIRHIIREHTKEIGEQRSTKKLTTDEFIKRAKEIHGDEYDYSNTEYVNSDSRVSIKCILHDHEFKLRASNHLRQEFGGCNICSNNNFINLMTRTNEEFINKASIKHNNIYDYSLTKYTHCHDKIIVVCKKHGKFTQQADSHVKGAGCPSCNTYRNENDCRNIMEDITGEKFIKDKPKFLCGLEYDGYNSNLNLAFEYNGVQHYEYVPFFHNNNEVNLNKQKRNDEIKKQLSHENGIYLIIIPYYIEDIRTFIEHEYTNYLFMNITI